MNALLWVLPVMVLVAGVGGLVVVFHRWRAQAAATAAPTDDDRALVAAALAASHAGLNGDPNGDPKGERT